MFAMNCILFPFPKSATEAGLVCADVGQHDCADEQEEEEHKRNLIQQLQTALRCSSLLFAAQRLLAHATALGRKRPLSVSVTDPHHRHQRLRKARCQEVELLEHAEETEHLLG